MIFLQHLTPEQNFLRTVYLSTLRTAELLSQFSVWLLTGTGAFLGIMVANLNSVTKVISITSLKWTLISLGVSILLGTVIRNFGIGISEGIKNAEELYEKLLCEEGKDIMAEIGLSISEVIPKISEPFFGPLRWWMDYSARRGTEEFLLTEKRFIKMLCFQIYLSAFQSLFIIVAIVILACGIQG